MFDLATLPGFKIPKSQLDEVKLAADKAPKPSFTFPPLQRESEMRRFPEMGVKNVQ